MIKNRELNTKGQNSSTGAQKDALQAAEIQKFLFDYSFDSETSDTSDKTDEVIIEEPEEIIPTFSKEELESAQNEGFIRGKEEGFKEASLEIEQSLLNAIGNLETQFENLFKTQQETAKSDLDNAILIAASVSRKITPSLNKQDSLDEIENMVANVMKEILEEPKVSIYIHPDLEPLLKENIGPLAKKVKYRGEIIILASDDLPIGDCNIEWESGGAQRNTESLLLEVDEIIERNLKEAPSMDNSNDKNVITETTISNDIKPENLES